MRSLSGRTALLAAAALGLSGLSLISDNQAGAMGGDNPAAAMLRQSYPTSDAQPVQTAPPPAVQRHQIRLEEFDGRRAAPERRKVVRTSGGSGGYAVCVRLCDGSFFPSNTASGGDAACQSQCPDAPTALYMPRPGSDRIEDAVSTSGALYSALPVAGRFRTTTDETCTCHRGRADYLAMVLQDRTLRKGDAVMTPAGVVVYEGDGSGAPRKGDFVAVAKERNLAANVRGYLAKMQSAPTDYGHDFGYPVAASASASAQAVTRGKVWVDGPATSTP